MKAFAGLAFAVAIGVVIQEYQFRRAVERAYSEYLNDATKVIEVYANRKA